MIKLNRLFFYLFTFFVTYLIYVYPYDVLKYFILKEEIITISSLYLNLFFYSIVIYYLRSHSTFLLFRILVYEGMGIGFISFWIVNLALLTDYIFSTEQKILGISSFLIIILISILGLIYGKLVFLKKIKINTSKIKNSLKLIFISDVHLGSNSIRHLNKIYSKIKNINFDLLLIGGDLIDSSSFDLHNLTIFKKIKAPIIFVSGNHEFYIKDPKEKLAKLKNFKINILDNKNFIFKDINIIGIGDNQSSEKQKIFTTQLTRKNIFNLLLVHKPSIWDDVNQNIDLMLSGHTHGGQIFPFNYFVKLQYKKIYGLYEKLNSKLYVSSGCGCWGPKMRLGTNNEILEIIISNNK